MDQRIALTNLIVAAIDRVNRTLQKFPVYVAAHTYNIIGAGAAETAGASGALATLRDTTGFSPIGVTAGISGASGSLSVATEIQGVLAISGTGNILGSLDSQPELISSADGISNVLDSPLDSQPGIKGIISGDSDVADGSLIGIWTNRGLIEGESGADAELEVAVELVGSCAGATSAVDENDELYL